MNSNITLNILKPIFPQQPSNSLIENASAIPNGKTKMIISNIISNKQWFSLSVNLLPSVKCRLKNEKTLCTLGSERQIGSSKAPHFIYIEDESTREIDLNYKLETKFDYFYIALVTSSIDGKDAVSFTINFQ